MYILVITKGYFGIPGVISPTGVKRRRSREESPSQEDESDRPHDLEFIHLTSQTKPKISLELFLLSVDT
jgi:hypothetical protein